MKRLLWGALLAVSLAVVGFGLGGFLAARVLAPPGEGMAGAAAAAGTTLAAVSAALIGLLVGAVLARALPEARLTRNALASALLGAAAVGLLLWSAAERRTARTVPDTSAAAAAGQPQSPPPLPPAGHLDSLQGLVTVPPESLPRFEVEEHAYEEEAVKVYGHRGNWYLVGLREGGRAWLDTRVTGRFLPLEELLTNRLNYLTAAWDARVRPEPDLSFPATDVRVSRAVEPEVPADVLESRRIRGTLWLRVEVHAESPCERGEKPPVIAAGWIPAWAPDGRPTAWYYARGC